MKCTECKVGYCAYRSTDPQRECPIQNGHRYNFSMPPQESGKGSIVPEGTHMVIDWSSFRREAAKDILCAMIEARKPITFQPVLIGDALRYTNALIEKLKQE